LVERLRILLNATSRSNGPVAVIEQGEKGRAFGRSMLGGFEPLSAGLLFLYCMIAAREYDCRSKTSYAPAAARLLPGGFLGTTQA
jgi:hypothetical protein